ncbi:MAG TPA: ABC transporter ATP-binding protein, partial [Candidatus Methanoperedens sp.]|nr:ABC transporter ATP-binding protein [Candidatus Methanoperedens sp.]
GLLGPNGAGKTTTLKMIYGSIKPSAGRVAVNGMDVASAPRQVKAMLGIAPQEDLLDPDLSVVQNLFFSARYRGLPAKTARERAEALLREAGLEEHAQDQVSHLSTGLRRRLALARAHLGDPGIVILDEPTRGLDRESRRRYLGSLTRFKAGGGTLLIATHDLVEAEALCDRAALMEGGRIRQEGSLFDILAACRDREPAAPSPAGEPA